MQVVDDGVDPLPLAHPEGFVGEGGCYDSFDLGQVGVVALNQQGFDVLAVVGQAVLAFVASMCSEVAATTVSAGCS